MAAVDEITTALQEIEPELRQPTQGGMDSVNLAARLRAVRKLLARHEERWIDLPEARRLLAVSSTDGVMNWVDMGFLRSRELPDGHMQVLLDDVLRERETREGLSAIGGDDLSDEELEIIYQARPGTAPWERDPKPDPTQ